MFEQNESSFPTASMDKLFDLMTMAVKYQLTMVKRPAEILLVTLNHFDAVYEFVRDNASCRGLMEDFYKRFQQVPTDSLAI